MNILFLTYVNRSGSTYLANLLSSSDKILVCPEGDRLVSYFLEDPGKKFEFNQQTTSKLSNIFKCDPKLKYWGMDEFFWQNLEHAFNNLEAFITILINYKNLIKPRANSILFKAERLVYLVRKIKNVHTNHSIKFISIIRDPRAVYTSQNRTIIPEMNKIFSKNPVTTALYWNDHVTRYLSLSSQNLMFLLRFEDLIYIENLILKKIGDFFNIELMGIKSDKGDLFNRIPEDQKSIHINICKQPIPEKINEWEKLLKKTEILIIEFITRKMMDKLGYDKKNKKYQYVTIYLSVILGAIFYYFRIIIFKILFRLNLT